MNLLALRLKLKKIKNDSPLDREWTEVKPDMVWHPTTGQMVALFNLFKPVSLGGMLKTEDINKCEQLLWQVHKLLVRGTIAELSVLDVDPTLLAIQSRVVPPCGSRMVLSALSVNGYEVKGLSPSTVVTEVIA